MEEAVITALVVIALVLEIGMFSICDSLKNIKISLEKIEKRRGE